MPHDPHRPDTEPGPERPSSGRDDPLPPGAPGDSVLTLVCETCGKDYFFEDEQPPQGMRCEKCGSTVFRSFHDRAGDEAADDFRESTARDLDPDDAEGDVLPGDLLDLNNP
jgi:hypothetical protein